MASVQVPNAFRRDNTDPGKMFMGFMTGDNVDSQRTMFQVSIFVISSCLGFLKQRSFSYEYIITSVI